MVDGQLNQAEHDLQSNWDGAELVADHLIDGIDRGEESVCAHGQFGARLASEVPDGAKVLAGEFSGAKWSPKVARPGSLELIGETAEGSRQVGGEVGDGPGLTAGR